MAIAVNVQLGAGLASQRGSVSDRAAMRALLARAARAALAHQRIAAAELSITLLTDDEIAAMNREFLSHDEPTDVIAFALYGDGEDPVGDLYIGYEQARRQAAANAVDLAEELARLAVHGTLHVLGYDHPDGGARVRSKMWRVQEDIVAGVFAP
jgi:probable rRNA maturation factor